MAGLRRDFDANHAGPFWIGADDISAFGDIPTGCDALEISSTASRRTATRPMSSSYVNVGLLGMALAVLAIIMQRKEVRNMKLAASFLAALLITGTVGALSDAMATPMAKDGILLKDHLTSDPYCHEKFPAIRENTFNDKQPALKDSMTGDVIDFYGPCDESPIAKDQVQEQKLENQHRLDRGFSD